MPPATGLHLTPTDENTAEIDALAQGWGGRVPIADLLADLPRRGRRTWLPLPGVRRAWTFDRADRRDPRWWPQGLSTSADAAATSEQDTVAGRRVVAVAWYAKDLPGDAGGGQGSRITFLDLDTSRYRHVLLVAPVLREGQVVVEPLHVHAGGLVWHGPWLHVAATGRGLHTFRLDDLLRVPDRAGGPAHHEPPYDHRYVLPARLSYRAAADDGHDRLRYSFLSLDRSGDVPRLLVGEYGRGDSTRRLARFALDPDTLLLATGDDGRARPLSLDEGVRGMQGAVVVRDRWFVTVSHGPLHPGSLYVGRPAALRRRRRVTPMGPEDLSWWPSTDELWSVSEHPRRRWVFSMRRGRFE